jgi:hypothetical protein
MQAGGAGTGATATMAPEAAADDREGLPCQEGADQPALGLRWHGLLNRGVIDGVNRNGIKLSAKTLLINKLSASHGD